MTDPANPYLAIFVCLLLVVYIIVSLIDAIWIRGPRGREPSDDL